MKKIALTAAAALAAIAANPALAQEAGDTVMGNDGNAIGTVADANEQAVMLTVGEYQIALPKNAFGTSDTGPTLNITRDQLVQMHEQQLAAAEAALAAALVEGAAVVTADPQPLGTIETIDGTNIVITREDETKVTLPREMFAVDPNGALMARIMMADLEAALAAQAG
ncbi:hypothetical protein [Aurantiacibacter rhizosphaerae]|uniref:Preprotein translocase subunit YajC n=1 Tax=Aurantiacibacter rhizosphaerae TaxID=2691582 RepID=A0A844XB72_9SPHN|nr:hypothetical protein [Aurantiacibacter rhizosphaerae]MWV27741.1 hypothetical protein [Aurantiacibacter rhizosphaerae]